MATTSSWIRVLVLAQLLVLGLSCRADNTDLTRPDQHPLAVQATYEAEDAELLDGITVVHDPGARGGRCLQMGDSGSVLFHVLVPDKGLYRLKIGYRAPHSDRAQRLLVNGREYAPEIGFAISPVWA
nr:hypothetical protein [Phycisphaerae bacterium]